MKYKVIKKDVLGLYNSGTPIAIEGLMKLPDHVLVMFNYMEINGYIEIEDSDGFICSVDTILIS